ncbi:hypothetical protein [Salinisphaera sp.]|uniref:hypothetical protein n=1 Tax=Salinisphaera sp. TaxID=1914330 RepID=UPI0025F6BA11|nr:hypothetical protein [Salinisphaera sp.]
MPASMSNSLIRILFAGLVILASAGCASNAVVTPSAPDQSVLAPAEQALAKARAADADTFAPRAVDASRRRISTARDILYSAARANRELNDTERARVEALVAAAELDARSALTQTQAKAVQTKLAELQGQLDGSAANATEGAR